MILLDYVNIINTPLDSLIQSGEIVKPLAQQTKKWYIEE